jgi:hypothetical protein
VRTPTWDGRVDPVSEIPKRTLKKHAPGSFAPRRRDLDQLAAFLRANPGQVYRIPAWDYEDDQTHWVQGDNERKPNGSSIFACRPGIKMANRNGRVYVWAEAQDA